MGTDGPLQGLQVVEFGGIGPAPYAVESPHEQMFAISDASGAMMPRRS